MARPTDSNEQLLCSFCGKSQHEVKKLIAGTSVYICNECVDLCKHIIDDGGRPKDVLDVADEMFDYLANMGFPPGQSPTSSPFGVVPARVFIRYQDHGGEYRYVSAIARACDLAESAIDVFLSEVIADGMPVKNIRFMRGTGSWLMIFHDGAASERPCTVLFPLERKQER